MDGEQLKLEIEKAIADTSTVIDVTSTDVTSTAVSRVGDITTEKPSLMGMPNTLLKKIFSYFGVYEMFYVGVSEVVMLESVCKRLYGLIRSDDFWSVSQRWLRTRESMLRTTGIRMSESIRKAPMT